MDVLTGRAGFVDKEASMEANPYAPPQVTELSSGHAGMTEAEVVRREHLSVEANIRTTAVLHMVGMALFAVPGFLMLLQGKSVSLLFLLIGGTLGIVGHGLGALNGRARWPALVISVAGLLAFPVGTIINAVILVNLTGAKAKRVFAPDYQEIIAATPHVETGFSRLAILTLALLGLMVLLVAAAVVLRLWMP